MTHLESFCSGLAAGFILVSLLVWACLLYCDVIEARNREQSLRDAESDE